MNIFKYYIQLLTGFLKSKSWLIQIIILVGLICILWFVIAKNKSLQQDLKQYDNNFKALSLERDSLNNSIFKAYIKI